MSKNQAISQSGHFNFGDRNNYSLGGGLPEGFWAIWFDFRNFQGQKKDGTMARGGPRLGVMGTCVNLSDPTAAPLENFWSMGTDANKSFAPDPDTEGKKLKPIPGGPGMSLTDMTNWKMFLDNLYDCGLPEGTLSDDLSVLDGIWLHIQHIPEPETRKTFQSKTSEYQDETQGPRKIPVPTEIMEGGRPWEGGGGMPSEPIIFGAVPPPPLATAAKAIPPKTPAPKTATKPAIAAAKTASKPGPPKPEHKTVAQPAIKGNSHIAVDIGDISTAAADAVSMVLGANPSGMKHLKFRVEAVKASQQKYGDEMASAIVDTYFSKLDDLNTLLEQYGYASNGTDITLA
jgi:hypothetical protein